MNSFGDMPWTRAVNLMVQDKAGSLYTRNRILPSGHVFCFSRDANVACFIMLMSVCHIDCIEYGFFILKFVRVDRA